MLSTNSHGPTRAILYARVSTDEQARSGYSLAQQIEALREYAAQEGYEVLEEIEDKGYSGANLARPGLDWVRDLVAAGDVDGVLAQDRDRLARTVVLNGLLDEELSKHGCNHPDPSQGRAHGGAGPGPPSARVGGAGTRGSGGEQSAGAKAPSTEVGAAWAAALLVRLDYDHPHCNVTRQRRRLSLLRM
jgi:Resolvase, N terminal domain